MGIFVFFRGIFVLFRGDFNIIILITYSKKPQIDHYIDGKWSGTIVQNSKNTGKTHSVILRTLHPILSSNRKKVIFCML